MRDKTNSAAVEKPLMVDAAPPELSEVWSAVGLFLLILLVFSALFLRGASPWLVTLGMMLLVLIARVVRRIPVPRRHPATIWALLALLLPLPFTAGQMADYTLYPPLLLVLAVAWSTVWLIRTGSAIRFSGLGLLTLGAMAALLSWGESRTPDSLFSGPETALSLVLLLIAFFPWLLMFRGGYGASVLGLYALTLTGVFAPVNLAALSNLFLRSPLLGQFNGLLAGLLLIVAVLLYRTTLKERRLWRQKNALRGLLLAMLPLAPVLLFLAVFHPDTPAGTPFAVYGALLGLSLAARERLIYEDPTRHPRSTPAPWWATFEEARIAAGALAAFLFRRSGGDTVDVMEPPGRRILDPSGTKIVNPYKDGSPLWIPLVMHLHSNRWEGAFSALEIVSHYTRLGAGSVILTDHNRITQIPHPNAGPSSYEHGWGPHNHHILVLGATKTIPDANAFGGTIDDHRRTLARLKPLSQFTILAHPRSGNAWSPEDVASLDYDAVELFNKSSDDTSPWDEALTSGLLVWGTAGDDCHDLRSRHQTGKRYLLLDLQGLPGIDEGIPPSPAMVIEALQSGRFVAMRLAEPPVRRRVTRHLPEPDAPRIASFSREGDVLNVRFADSVEVATVLSDGGTILQMYENCSNVRLSVPMGDRYVRLEVCHGDHILALNPLARVAKDARLPWPTN
ncbi:MAG: hypothetical protein V2A56_10075 [bacterium]